MNISFNSIEVVIGVVTVCLMVLTQVMYIIDVINKKVTPSVLSWFGWALLMGAGMLSQFIEEGWQHSQGSVVAATIGCLAIGIIALATNHFSLKKVDWAILSIGIVCVILYYVSKNAWLTTIFAIVADFIIAIPTLIKVLKHPQSEKSSAWYISLTAWILTLFISFNHGLLYALFPMYLFSFTFSMVFLMNRKEKSVTLDS